MATKSSKIEAQVIDDALLIEGVNSAKNLTEAEAARGLGDVTLVDIAPTCKTLSLSFKRIVRIENLIGFDTIVKLCLDNNYIEEIINLGHLRTLKWLDLSFNKIRKIQGIENLVNLEDLSLYSNKLSVVGGLESCTNLQCLSLGNNRIDSLEQVIKLRQLRSLRMCNLADNPVCNEAEYKMTVLAYLDTLKYLDYALVDPAECLVAKEQYHDELLDLEEKESVIIEKKSREASSAIYLQSLDNACLTFAHVLFDDLFLEDAEVERLKHLPGIKEAVEHFRSGFKQMSEEFIQNSMEKYEKKVKEISEFDKAVLELRTLSETDSAQLIESFNKSKKVVVALLTAATSIHTHSERVQMIGNLQKELDKVCDELMSIELRLVDKFEVLIDNFDNRLMEIKNFALENHQLFFRATEELEDKFSTAIRVVVHDLIERHAREELAEDYLDDEAMGLVVDKDSCLGLVGASHDAHIGRIMKKEDEARSTEIKR